MWVQMLEAAGAFIARLTPHTPPATWLPFVVYGIKALSALVIAAATFAMTRSRLASAAAAITYGATANMPESVGPLVIALAFYGALFGSRFAAQNRGVYFILALAVVGTFTGHYLLTWVVAGLGLAAVRSTLGASRRVAGPALVAVLTLVMITARLPAAETSVPLPPKSLGHSRATATSLRALLSNVPADSKIVDDDPITAMLMRAITPDLERARVHLVRIENEPARIREVLKTNRVFALPYAQATLQLQGFEIVDSLHTADRGLAEVRIGGECIDATNEWRDAATLTGRTSLAFDAGPKDRTGPVVIYLQGNEPIQVNAVNWPSRTLRGFSPRTFDLQNAQDRQDLARQRTEDGGPWTMNLSATHSITRVALWRMPDSARSMLISLSAAPSYTAVKLAPEARGSVSVCPAFPAPVSAIR